MHHPFSYGVLSMLRGGTSVQVNQYGQEMPMEMGMHEIGGLADQPGWIAWSITDQQSFDEAVKNGLTSSDPDEQREAAAAIVHEGRRLEALSRKLLALLGLNEEGVELTAVPLPALWPRLHAACPDVSLRTPAAAPTVRGDADLLLDLLCNLVQNAAKASAPGAPVLVLCAQAGDAVTLTVADRGCGIPPELIPRVTEPFYMVDKSRARRQGGSGLGLALCQRIAAAHGSALRIESEPGRGTRVSVTLPVWKEDAP